MHPNRLKPPSTLDQAFYEAQLRLNQIPNDILKKLNNTPSELSHFIQTLPTIQTMENKRQQLIEHNRHLAMQNLTKEPELLHARRQLSHSFAELAPLRDTYLKTLPEIPSPDLILAQLQSAAHASEHSNDEMIETFFHTPHNIDIFVKNFLHDRQETIKLRFLAEKFFDLYQIEQRKE